MPKVHKLIPYLAIVYARWFWNQCGFMLRGGLSVKMCGFSASRRCGTQALDTK